MFFSFPPSRYEGEIDTAVMPRAEAKSQLLENEESVVRYSLC